MSIVFKYEMSRNKQKLSQNNNKKVSIPSFALGSVIGVFILLISIIFTPYVFAWETNQSAEAECVLNTNENVVYAKIRARFTNKDKKDMNLTATDNQSGKSVTFPTLRPNQTHTLSIQTRMKSLVNGTVTFSLTWADGSSGTDSKTVSYNAIACDQPTVTPTPTTTTPTPTGNPTPTNTPGPTSTPTPGPTATPTPGTTTSSNPTPTPKQVVLAATSLGKTGAFTQDIANTLGAMSITSMIYAAGLYVKTKSKKFFKK
ncbi:MAG: hypothetical protein Q8P26_05515 [Candidatus Levybacteria bacterium]|nr:hypothetical protein [Candidatus Levybacteria bacterium]